MKTINITGKRWFQKSFGNTYHTVSYSVDGQNSVKLPMTYGYGDAYMYTAVTHMEKEGIIPEKLPGQTFKKYCKMNGIKLNITVKDVQRKKDL